MNFDEQIQASDQQQASRRKDKQKIPAQSNLNPLLFNFLCPILNCSTKNKIVSLVTKPAS